MKDQNILVLYLFNKGYCLNLFLIYINKILLELFNFVQDRSDYQEYLIYIQFLTELLEKFGVKNFYQFLSKILSILPSNKESEKLILLQTKTTLIEVCFMYFNLKLLFIKFAFEANYLKLAEHHCFQVRDSFVYMRSFKSSLKGILNVKIEKHLLELKSKTLLGDIDNESDLEFNLYDKFILYYISVKSTLMKYFEKLKYNTIFILVLKRILNRSLKILYYS